MKLLGVIKVKKTICKENKVYFDKKGYKRCFAKGKRE